MDRDERIARESVVAAARALDAQGLNRGTSGNVSVRFRDVEQDRLGVTLSGQWRPTERTTINFDNLYSKMTQISTNYQIGPVGLNRNNTNGNRTTTAFSYQTYPTTSATNNSYANRRAAYANCATQAATAFRDAIDCGQSLYGSTPIFTTAPGATSSRASAARSRGQPTRPRRRRVSVAWGSCWSTAKRIRTVPSSSTRSRRV
ncbi:hypothetical protein OMR07_21580 [Methylobacterium organophilum]|nr:hypothetical protein [Methylobacterium organophilum]